MTTYGAIPSAEAVAADPAREAARRLLCEAAECLYGPLWVRPLTRALLREGQRLEHFERSVIRWRDGDRAVPPAVLAQVAALLDDNAKLAVELARRCRKAAG